MIVYAIPVQNQSISKSTEKVNIQFKQKKKLNVFKDYLNMKIEVKYTLVST